MISIRRTTTAVAWLLAAACTLAASAAFAHGTARPQHGGIVKTANELSFELVPLADGADVYLYEEDDPMKPQGFAGKLTLIGADGRHEAPLKVTGDKLSARGLKPASGDRVVVVVTTQAQQATSVRYLLP
ncbi:hypothetical protein [Frateuria defendens]|uniref:hypothetical protein n=1 Tax=Frateuria defendens TaxID=2219559 RepID=UPI00066FF54D|nr:hypothetical protein [Frateuria defendens]